MELEDFEIFVQKHSLCPGDLLYNSNALMGKSGECANNVKKMKMAEMRPEWTSSKNDHPLMTVESFRPKLKDELGDAMFYLTRLALDNGWTLQDVMKAQAKKLIQQSMKYQRDFLK